MSAFRFILPVAAAAVLVLTGCSSAPGKAEPAAGDIAGYWVTGETYSGLREAPFLDLLESGEWNGSDGCNKVTGTWKLGSEGALTVTAGPSTLMGCDGAPLPMFMAQAVSVARDGDALILSGPEKKELVKLLPGKPESGAEPSTAVADIDATGNWGPAEAGTENAPRLELAADGRLSGTDGCNRILGTWQGSEDKILFDQMATTRMACEGVDTWLSGASTATLEGDVLTVLGVSDDEIGRLSRLSE